ncbi:TPA: hypothetical protein ACK2W9_003799 [Klebsiella michiganensis]|jgi:hypothetical protein|uniref:hypothetical protein n=1 Tax=Klebsiella/Raoultella group TaxID=2890311 RepID=UPI0006696D95|nr:MULTISPECIES: hypothetical protein [Klebsiella/Raoultella group]EJG2384058.1 hypothetical protein [Raoultella ornithinolytica]ELB6486394.1 hypothetical protein [Raoultella ornithinolytica]ELB7344412.1 hypothetical protein [Klebsiella michiganensis]ELC2235303.1 hypothetical protein [Klebsiella michiganensis]ELJ6256817.1 hypothetical protein [Klebsiella michiganensis]
MITTILELIKTGLSFFQKKQEKEVDSTIEKNKETNETNREEIKKGLTWRNALGFAITLIILYNWIIVPVLDAFGIVVIQVPLGQLLQVLLIMVGGS